MNIIYCLPTTEQSWHLTPEAVFGRRLLSATEASGSVVKKLIFTTQPLIAVGETQPLIAVGICCGHVKVLCFPIASTIRGNVD